MRRDGAVAVLIATAALATCARAPESTPGTQGSTEGAAVSAFRRHCLPAIVSDFKGLTTTESLGGSLDISIYPAEKTCEILTERSSERSPAEVIEAVNRQLAPELMRLDFRLIKKTAEHPPVVTYARPTKNGCVVVIATASDDQHGGLLILTAGEAPAPNLPTLIKCPSS